MSEPRRPLRLFLAACGSTGDVRPFLALGRRLRERGHRVRLCAEPEVGEQAGDLGLAFTPLADPIPPDDLRRIQRAATFRNSRLAYRLGLEKRALRQPREMLRRCLDAVEGCDLALCHFFAFLGQEAALLRGVPWLPVWFTPGMLPTRHGSPLHLPDLGRFVNRLTWRGVERLLGRGDAYIGGVVRDLDGLRVGFDFCRDVWRVSPALVAASPVLAPLPEDAPAGWTATGEWVLADPGARVPDEVERFLASGEPPVLVNFGSMAGSSGAETGALVLEALRRSGARRAILQRGVAGLHGAPGDLEVCFADFLPHDLVLPRVACVVHHCGAGTSHAVARAGIPSVPVPHLGDQRYWAQRLAARGAATPALSRRRLTVDRLARRMRRALGDPALGDGARHLRDALAGEDGATVAARRVEELAGLQGAASGSGP